MPRIGLTHEKVIENAANLANKKGLSYVTISSLAEFLGVKKPSLYNHIKSQEDIYEGIMIYGWKNGVQPIAENLHENNPQKALKKYARAFYKYALDNPGIFEAMLWYNKYKSPELIEASEKIYDFFFAQTDKMNIDRESANHLLRTFRAFLEGFLLLVIHNSFGNPISIEESFELSLDVLISGMKKIRRKEK
jgi:AcrR family transcriptional regulator